MKVKTKLPLVIVLMSTLPILLVAMFAYFFVLNLSSQYYEQLIDNQSNASEKHLTDFFTYQADTLHFASRLSAYPDLLAASPHPNSAEYKEQWEIATRLQMVAKTTNIYLDHSYLLDKNGRVLSATQEETLGENFADTLPFTSAMSTDAVCSEIVDTAQGKKLMLSVAVLDSQNANAGVLMRLINLEYISKYIDDLKIGETGYLYILDDNGETLSHYYNDRVTTPSGPDDMPGGLQELVSAIQDGSIKDTPTQFFDYALNTEKIRANYQYSPTFGWTVVAAIPYREIYQSAHAINTTIVAIAIAVMLLSLAVGLATIRSITKPLAYFNEKIKSIAAGNLQEKCDYVGHDEFQELCKSANDMIQNLYTSQQMLSSAAMTDVLTGMANRKSIYTTLDLLFDNHKKQAAMLIDLDGFKKVNDTLGHDYGDDVLISVGHVLEEEKSNTVFPCRLGGDEFFLFLTQYDDPKLVMEMAEQILAKIQNIHTALGQPIHISASIGVSFSEIADTNQSRLIKKADLAMYEIKRSGKSQCKAFDNLQDAGLLDVSS